MKYDDGKPMDLDLAIEDFEWLKETKKKKVAPQPSSSEEESSSEDDSDSGSEYSESDDSDSEYESGHGAKEGGGEKGPVCVNHEAKGVKKQRAFDAVRAFLKMNWEKITLHMHMKEHEVHQQKGRRQNKRNQRKKR